MADKRIVIMWDLDPAPAALPSGVTLAGYRVTVTTADTAGAIVWQSDLLVNVFSVQVPRIPAGRYAVDVTEVASDATVTLKSIRAHLDATDAPTPDGSLRTYQPLKGVTFAVSDA